MACFMQVKDQQGCGSFRNTAEIIPLRECCDDIEAHLRRNHLLSERKLTEYQLILFRAGNFDVTEKQLTDILICPKHRASLGKYYQCKTSCQYPEHKKTTVKGKITRAFNVQVSREVLEITGLLIPVGSREYISKHTTEIIHNKHICSDHVSFL